MRPKAWLFVTLSLFVAYYALTWARSLEKRPPDGGDGEDGGMARGAANFGLLMTGVLVGAVFGWVMGGGVQIVDNGLRFFAPFNPPDRTNLVSANVTMAAAMLSMMIVGGSVAYLLAKGRGGWPRP